MSQLKAGWQLTTGLVFCSLLPGFFIAASIAGVMGAAEGAGLAGGAIILGYGVLGILALSGLSLLIACLLPRPGAAALLFTLLGLNLAILLLIGLRIADSDSRSGLFAASSNISPPTSVTEPVPTAPKPSPEPAETMASFGFHTDPSCWAQPRNYHQPVQNTEWAERVRLISSGRTAPEQPGVFSPNQAYRFWVTGTPGDQRMQVLIDNETAGLLVLEITQPLQTPTPQWLTEKLLYLRIAWGRVVFSDVLIDVERAQLLYHELVHDGGIAYQQYQQGCVGPDAHDCKCPGGFNLTVSASQQRMNENSVIGLLAMPGILPDQSSDATAGSLPGYLKIDGEYRRITDNLDGAIIKTMEYSYEQPGAVTFQRDGDWFEVRTTPADRKLWVRMQPDFQFHPIEDLLPNRPNYLNRHWDHLFWAEPGGEHARRRAMPDWQQKPDETPVVIEQARMVGGQLWLEVDFYTAPICSGSTPDTEDGGWIPAYSESGHLAAWFFSRGC